MQLTKDMNTRISQFLNMSVAYYLSCKHLGYCNRNIKVNESEVIGFGNRGF